uniref:SPRY domain-containing protein 7 n=1 Tax=Cyprinus carpio carpio TaxID=630221 RepID=A0A9J7ZJM4_CYPCA
MQNCTVRAGKRPLEAELCVSQNSTSQQRFFSTGIHSLLEALCALQFDACNCTSGDICARMAAMFTCCLGCCGDGGPGHAPLKEMPTVQLDTHHMGTDVVIVKSGRRICGTGACLANAPLHQNKSYFEFKIQSTGVWGIGVATQKVNLNQVPLGQDSHSLVLRHDGSIYHNNEEKNRLPANSLPQEGDIVGVTYDHVELSLYLNGKNMQCPASGIRGTVFPIVYGCSAETRVLRRLL